MPPDLEEGVIYISLEFGTAIHKCVCGCGNKVVTPLSPSGWQVTFDGETISLYPSIGNWAFECKTHYWIIKNEIKYAKKWNDSEIQKGRKKDSDAIEKHFSKKKDSRKKNK
jgi:hypothetical protein